MDYAKGLNVSIFKMLGDGTSLIPSSSCACVPEGKPVKDMNRKWWLTLMALLYVAPATFAIQDHNNPKRGDPLPLKHFQPLTVPEGGSSLVCVLGAGVTCLGAMLVRSRIANSSLSDKPST
jgi:hypothetical protein